MRSITALTLFASGTLLVAGLAVAAHAEDYTLTIQDHKFTPTELTVPVGTQVKITVINKDASAAEFESKELNREKVIEPNGTITVLVGPLEAGSYGFVEEFHEDVAKGTIIAK